MADQPKQDDESFTKDNVSTGAEISTANDVLETSPPCCVWRLEIGPAYLPLSPLLKIYRDLGREIFISHRCRKLVRHSHN